MAEHERIEASPAPVSPASPRTETARSRARRPTPPPPPSSPVSPEATRMLLTRLGAQAKLEVGSAADPAEREADRVAEEVVRQIMGGSTSRSADPTGEVPTSDGPTSDPAATDDLPETGQPPATIGRIRRNATTSTEVGGDGGADPGSTDRPGITRTIGRIRRNSVIGAEGGEVDPATERRLTATRGGGKPLSGNVRGSMESAFGADLGAVRLHEGPTATELNDSMQASALTLGSDIYMRDRLDAGSPSGMKLLAHELTHVMQQGGAGVRRSPGRVVRRHSVKDAPPAPDAVEKVQEDPAPDGKKARRQMIRRDLTTGGTAPSPKKKPPSVIHMDPSGVGHDAPDPSKAPSVIHMDPHGVGHKAPDPSKAPSVIHMDPHGVGHKAPDPSQAPSVLYMDPQGVGQKAPDQTMLIDKAFLVADGTSTATASLPGDPTQSVQWSVWSKNGENTGTTIDQTGKITAGNKAVADEQELRVKAGDKSDPWGNKVTFGDVPLRSAKYDKALTEYPKFVAAGPYKYPKYITANGFGRFDAEYSPATKTLGIDMRIKFIFPDDKNRFFDTKKKRLDREIRHQKYISKFITHVEGAWSQKFQFENVREPKTVWSQLNPVSVDIRVTPVSKNEHFLAKINTKTNDTANVTPDGELNMFKGDDTSKETMTDITKSGELQRLDKASPDMLFDAGTANFTKASKRSMDFLGDYVRRLHNPAVTLEIQGFGINQPVADQRSAAVKSGLIARGVAAPHTLTVASSAVGGKKAKASIKASLPKDFKNTQDVTAHEFGHMLGLDDEYATRNTPAGTGIETHDRVGKAFGNDVADQTQLAGIDSASVMDGGDDVRIYHYITLWDVLNNITVAKATLPTPRFGEADWKFIG